MAKEKESSKKNIYLLSDSSGNLLEHFFNAILTQFPKDRFQFHTRPFLKNTTAIESAVKKIKKGVVFHSFASQKNKEWISRLAKDRGLACWDVTGPTADFFEKATGVHPFKEVRPVHPVDIGYLGRMRAIEFAMQHDDSQRLEQLSEAEIILVGISRVSKSPTALFLAYRGFKVANISILPSQGLPKELENHRKKNVVAFTMQPRNLSEIRQRRFQKWNLGTFEYENLQEVIREVMESEAIYKKKGWPMIDTTELAVEETSTLVLSALHLKPKALSISTTESI